MEKRKIEGRITQKMEQIREYLDFLESIVPNGFEEYKNDLKTKAACERYAEKIVEAVIDLAFFMVSYKNLQQPTEEETIFAILLKGKIISCKLAEKLNNAKGMRNFIVHKYGDVNDEIIFEAVSCELKKDIEEFLSSVSKEIK
jgi:uncharacterized protein YutE (UPF0331/DUF86 family)